jgi:serine/threonine protein kinase/tetratricopeptide (TPR) repeat protein
MGLTPQQWENVKALFEVALDKAPAERNSFLASSAEDPEVRREVERLLAHHVESGGLLSTPVVAPTPISTVPASARSFSSGDLLADRFRITRFLARGGMGEVYEAEDIELHERVALKSIRNELLHDPRVLERFKREVHLSRKVTHPNVCRIFDLFRHSGSKSPESTRSSVVLVAMELLEGETLAEFLRQQPRPSIDEIRPVAVQMAAGLGAAHAAGVLHRDFKPGNVILVPGQKKVRAVITDFGLALRSNDDVSLGASITGAGEVLGTPAYMSPEQVEGKDLTPASDVYSLGLVLYQMVTGTRAFEDATPLSMAVRRIREDPVPPRSLVPDLDRQWEAVILKCLQRDPKNRFQSGDEVAESLKSGETESIVRPVSSKHWLGILALVFVLAAAVFVVQKLHHPVPQGTTASVPARPSIAVLPFHNLSGRSDTEWVSTALPEMLTAELAAGERLRTFPGENVTRASTDLGLTGKQTLAPDTLSRLRKYLGSDYVVLGSYLDQGSEAQVRIDLWLQDTKTGQIAATISEKGSESSLDDLATRAGTDLRHKLGVGDVTPTEAAVVQASLPSNPDAVRLYSEGLAKLRVADAIAAQELLQKAVAADPNFSLGHSALADAWERMGYDVKAREESKKARDLSSGLSHEERLWVEGRDWELNRKWDKAAEIYRTLFDFFPDNIEYGLHLATAQKQARNVDVALATLASLRNLPAPQRDDPRIDMQQAEVYEIKGAFKDEQASAENAARRARDLGAKLFLARALNQEARALQGQGKLEDAVKSAQEAASISDSAGGRLEVARALTVIGLVRYNQGNLPEALDAFNHALTAQREIGNQRGAATTLNNIANVLGEQGDLSGSTKMLQEALLVFQDLGDKHSAVAVLNNIATRTYRQGELEQAKKMLQEALAGSKDIGDQERGSIALYNLGEVLRWQGDLKGARKMYQQSEDLCKQIDDQSGVAYALSSLGDVSTAEGNFAAAKGEYDQAIALRTQMGEKGNTAESQMALSLLQIEQGHPAEVETTLRQVREEFRKEKLSDDQILSSTMLARILISRGSVADAVKEMDGIRDLLAKNQDFSVRLRASIMDARVQAAAGHVKEALQSLQSTIASAKKSGYLGYELEGQLAEGEMNLGSSNRAAGRETLAEVRTRAQQHGFGLIANQAARKLANPTENK